MIPQLPPKPDHALKDLCASCLVLECTARDQYHMNASICGRHQPVTLEHLREEARRSDAGRVEVEPRKLIELGWAPPEPHAQVLGAEYPTFIVPNGKGDKQNEPDLSEVEKYLNGAPTPDEIEAFHAKGHVVIHKDLWEATRAMAEARRLREIEVSDEVRGLLTAHGSDGTVLVCGEFANGREFVEKYRVARRSDAGRVEVPEISLEDSEEILRSFPASLPAWEDGSWSLAFNKVADFLRARLSPSPQPATGAAPEESHPIGTADSGYFRRELRALLERLGNADGPWLARYLSRLAAVAEPSPQPATGAASDAPDVAIPMGTALQRLGARLADLLDDEAFNNIETNYLIPAIRELEKAPQPSADVVVHPGKAIPDGVPCGHPGCLHHVSHPCEGCGRVAGRSADVVVVPREEYAGHLDIERLYRGTAMPSREMNSVLHRLDALRSSTNHEQKEA